MFTFIKKVIKTGTATSSYPLEPIAVDKNFRGKPEQNPQQCIGCAACVNACPSNALTVETDLATGELAWEFNLGRCIFCGRCEEVCPTAATSCNSPASRCATAASAIVLSPSRKRSTTPLRCLSTTATAARKTTAKALRLARNVSARNAWCRPTVLN